MKKIIVIAGILLLVLSVSGCAAAPNDMKNVTGEDGKVAGFWLGLWQGFISPFVFLISLFNHNLNIYEVHNNGNWYNFGFMVGVSAILGGGGASSNRRRRD